MASMKMLPALVSLTFVTAASAQTNDIRTVSGKQVNLAPLHAWYSNTNAPRPLKHWRKLRLIEPEGIFQDALCFKCEDEDDGAKRDILIAHLPSEFAPWLETNAVNAAQVLRLTQTLADDERELLALEADFQARQAYVSKGLAELEPGIQNLSYGRDEMIRRTEEITAGMEKKRQNLDTVRNAVEEERRAIAKAQEQTTVVWKKFGTAFGTVEVFAMFTGQSAAGRQIWDCGQ